MPTKKGTRARHPSATEDNARPGSPTSLDVILNWLTTPGNVKRWRTQTRGPLCREVVDAMRAEDIAHRDAQYVRYKVDAIEKKYIMAKQWLLETGMHDAYMRSKATKEVKAHVEHLCPPFMLLDPAFRGVSFTKKNTEPIELDGDSAESVEGEKNELESEENDEVDESDEIGEDDDVEEDDEVVSKSNQLMPVDQSVQRKVVAEVESQPKKKKKTFRDLLSSAVNKGLQEVTAGNPPAAPKKRIGRPPKSAAVMMSRSEDEAKKESNRTRKTQKEPVGKDTVSAERNTVQEEEVTRVASKTVMTVNAGKKKTQEDESNTKKRTNSGGNDSESQSNAGKQKSQEKLKQTASRAKKTPKQTIGGKTGEKAAVSAKHTATNVKQTAKKGNAGKQKTTVTASPIVEDKQVVTPSNTRGRKSSDEALPSVEPTTNNTKDRVEESYATKRKIHEEEVVAAKRARLEDELAAQRVMFQKVEHKALLKRIEDEEQQRQEQFAIERAKMKCDLEAKQIQVQYEKATARKKLEQLGLSQEEIDRVLPL